MPNGFASPIVFKAISWSFISTLQIAPGILPVPHTIFPPSNAGPAAVDVT